ncbi:hypothetical protein AA0115_g12413 [Alternaria tenuissima]|uniref:Heterokaryon incompatibility domain-containing protein n=1 Tax=Alternaria tenuissima TaxID=119927 RepID=A0AB37VZA7_9PLEO|nr:hypothetical protein AA0115_g12413 [Alternaria tenuissima]
MRAIYSGAQSIIVATETGASTAADRLIQILGSVGKISHPISDATIAADTSFAADTLNDELTFSALEAFFGDPYWKRIWILQEFAIGYNTEFLIGNRTIAATKLRTLLEKLNAQSSVKDWWIEKMQNTQSSVKNRWDQVNTVFKIRMDWQREVSLKLLLLLEVTQGSLCSVRHDRIFGLLGLSVDALKYLPEPNYDIDLTTMTVAITRAYIQRNTLEIIFLAPHCPHTDLPTWSPNLFHFDSFPPESRIIRMISNSDSKSRWRATSEEESSITFQDQSLLTPAARIGSIRSAGTTFSDPTETGFPVHDTTWAREVSSSHLCREFYEAMLEILYTPNAKPSSLRTAHKRMCAVHGHSFVKSFLPSYGSPDPEMQHSELVTWISANRAFFTGASTLAESATQLRHPLLMYGWNAWSWTYWDNRFWGNEAILVWRKMSMMAKLDMRLMCLDGGPEYQIGWAAKGARLHDEVFLIPGCSSPAILRKRPDAKYEVVGDAIVTGAMQGELWEKLRLEHVQDIEIV